MSITIRQKDGIVILEPTGKIMSEVIPELREIMTTQIDKSETPRILIDLKRVHKMDSAGLGTLINAYNMARAKKGRIGVINVGKNIKNLIVQTRIINIFEHFNTENAAVFAFSRWV